MEKIDSNSNILDWYRVKYPTDEWAIQNMNVSATFESLFNALDRHENVYVHLLGASADSLVRERIFEKLAEVMEVPYDYIYNQWLQN